MPIFVPGSDNDSDGPGRFPVKKQIKTMTTIELAKRTNTKYFIEYICADLSNTYFQLVRAKDAAILAAYNDLTVLYAECFVRGIHNEDVTLW